MSGTPSQYPKTTLMGVLPILPCVLQVGSARQLQRWLTTSQMQCAEKRMEGSDSEQFRSIAIPHF